MPTEKETVILDFQVSQGDAISELEKTKKSIIGLKEEQNELNKAYKTGTITQEEYVSELVRVENVLKKQTSTYSNLQKSVTGVKSGFDKLIESNSNLLSVLDKINPGTQQLFTNLGSIQKGFTSTLGAVDKFGFSLKALNSVPILQLFSALTSSVSYLNDLYKTSLPTVEDYLFSNKELTKEYEKQKGALDNLDPSIKRQIEVLKEIGGQEERINEIRKDSLQSRISVEEKRLSDIQNQQKQAAENLDSLIAQQQKYVSNYGAASGAITANIITAQEANKQINDSLKIQTNLVEDLRTEYQILNIQTGENAIKLSLEKYNKEKEIQKNIRALRIASIQDDDAREIESIRESARNEINELRGSAEQIAAQRAYIEELSQKKIQDVKDRIEEERRKSARGEVSERGAGGTNLSDIDVGISTEIDTAKATGDILIGFEKNKQDQLNEISDKGREYRTLKQEAELEQALYYADALVSLASIGGEQSALFKAAAIAQTTIATYSSATKAFDSLAGIPYVGPALGAAAAAAAIANGLANVAQISGIAAAGGADFTTKGPTMLIVGDNPGGVEHVSVKPISGKGKTRTWNGGVAAAGGVNFTAQGIDGGAAMNQATAQVNTQLMMMNAFKNMPQPVVSAKEMTKVQRRVEIKENISRVGGRRSA